MAIIISHPDRENFNYLYDINWNVDRINQVIIGGTLQDYYDSTSSDFVQIYNWLQRFNGLWKLYTINSEEPCIENCDVTGGIMNWCLNIIYIHFNVLTANIGPTANEKSIVMQVVHDNPQQQLFSLLLAGDMEGMAAIEIVQSLGSELQSTVYQMANHGASSLANAIIWLNSIKPLSAFASSAYNFGVVTISIHVVLQFIIFSTSRQLYQPHLMNSTVVTIQVKIQQILMTFLKTMYVTSPMHF